MKEKIYFEINLSGQVKIGLAVENWARDTITHGH